MQVDQRDPRAAVAVRSTRLPEVRACVGRKCATSMRGFVTPLPRDNVLFPFSVMDLMLALSGNSSQVPAFRRKSPGGVTSAGPFIGTAPLFSALPLISGALEWLVGLATIILVWQRAAGQFYAASGQARAVFREPRR
jgi:hypothetical protein